MYRTYKLTEDEKDKITMQHWDGDTYYYSVFDTQEEYDEERRRLDKIESDYRRAKEAYLRSLRKGGDRYDRMLCQL